MSIVVLVLLEEPITTFKANVGIPKRNKLEEDSKCYDDDLVEIIVLSILSSEIH